MGVIRPSDFLGGVASDNAALPVGPSLDAKPCGAAIGPVRWGGADRWMVDGLGTNRKSRNRESADYPFPSGAHDLKASR